MKNDLGNKEIMSQNIRYYMEQRRKSRQDMCDALGVKYTTLTDWINGNTYPRIDKIELMANYFGIKKSDLVEDRRKATSVQAIRIPVYGRIPAGVPLEAVQDILDWEEISPELTADGSEYIALKVKGDSMYPKYMEGDVLIIRIQPDCESGEDAVVYVNGYEATLKKVVKKPGCLVLQPLNPAYDPTIYDYDDELNPVKILGVVEELRRKVR